MNRLSRLLFVVTLGLAAILAGSVMLAPRVYQPGTFSDGWDSLLALFAQDAVVRRTALAGAVGLFVTAWICFFPGWRSRSRKPPAQTIVGA